MCASAAGSGAVGIHDIQGSRRNKAKHWEKYKSFRTVFESACQHANLPDVTPHVPRHTFASRLVMKGVDPRTVQELGGWKRWAVSSVGRASAF
jgi:integrase